jgi:hypothetical protein
MLCWFHVVHLLQRPHTQPTCLYYNFTSKIFRKLAAAAEVQGVAGPQLLMIRSLNINLSVNRKTQAWELAIRTLPINTFQAAIVSTADKHAEFCCDKRNL